MSRQWTAEWINRSFLQITIRVRNRKSFEQDVMLKSDDHWDNPKCQRDLLKGHMDEAVARDAPILGGGDLFCAMQGKYDKRSSKKDLRPEHQDGPYFTTIVNDAAQWYAPYASNMVAEGQGNHESAIEKRHEVSLTQEFCSKLSALGGSEVWGMGYGYWVRFSLIRYNQRRSFLMYVYHGSGGGGPVTKGVIQTNRRAVMFPDADIIMSGHVHEAWLMPLKRVRVTQANRICHDLQWHVSTPTYKEEYEDGHGGWHVERGAPPKPLGCYWLRFYMEGDEFKFRLIPNIQ